MSSSIKFQCEHCGYSRRVNERLAGRRIRCPGCEQAITIPTPVAVEEVEADVDAIGPAAAAARSGAVAAVEPLTNGHALTATSGRIVIPPLSLESHSREPMTPKMAAAPASSAGVLFEDDDPLPPRTKRDEGELDMTPMVDVTFLLLIFFMVTASFSLQKAAQMPKQTSDLPSSAQPEEPTEELDPVELEIDENGGFLVMAAEWERETPGKQNLVLALKESIGANRDPMRLNIKVHENAKLQYLVDGMDAGTIAGFAELQVTEVDGFD